MPTQLVKWFGKDAFPILAKKISRIALAPNPPKAWRSLLLIPLYKGSGSPLVCSNYRSLAVMGPLVKLYMALIE